MCVPRARKKPGFTPGFWFRYTYQMIRVGGTKLVRHNLNFVPFLSQNFVSFLSHHYLWFLSHFCPILSHYVPFLSQNFVSFLRWLIDWLSCASNLIYLQLAVGLVLLPIELARALYLFLEDARALVFQAEKPEKPFRFLGFSVFLVFTGAVKFYPVSNFFQTNKKIPK